MEYSIIISDSVDTLELPILEVPITESTIEGATDVVTLDMNIYTDFFALKKAWAHTWKYLTEAEFDALKAFYDRQFELYQYPLITITGLGVEDIVVRMKISPREVADDCGTVQNVTVEFRETIQMSQGSTSS